MFPKSDEKGLLEAGVCLYGMFTRQKILPPAGEDLHSTIAYASTQSDLLFKLFRLLDEELGNSFMATLRQPKTDIDSS